MAARYPLVLNGTTIQELQSSDTLAGVDAFASGTTMLFVQAAAPTGWTLSTTHNNKALRIVSGSGGGSGGSLAFTTAFGSGSTDATTLTTSQMPGHGHSVIGQTAGVYPRPLGDAVVRGLAGDGGSGTATYYTTAPTGGNAFVQNTGSGGSHTHSLSLAVQYVDAIICVKA